MAHAAPHKLSTARQRAFTNAVLGRRFDLSVAHASRAKMQTLNRTYRRINRPTDILSFPLSKSSGEIVLCLPEVRSHARLFGMTYDEYLPYLFIHGLVHLKGHEHGAIMDRLEQKYCRAFRIRHPDTPALNGTKNRGRH